MPERINAGQPLVIAGAAALLVSLFLDWYEPPLRETGVSAWTAFEVLDIVLAGLALVALAGALPIWPAEAGRATLVGYRWLPWLGLAALAFVIITLIHDPPGAEGHSLEVGAWVGLAGSVLLAIGGLLSTARISLVVSSRAAESPGGVEPGEMTEPYPPPTEPATSEESPTEESPAARPETDEDP